MSINAPDEDSDPRGAIPISTSPSGPVIATRQFADHSGKSLELLLHLPVKWGGDFRGSFDLIFGGVTSSFEMYGVDGINAIQHALDAVDRQLFSVYPDFFWPHSWHRGFGIPRPFPRYFS